MKKKDQIVRAEFFIINKSFKRINFFLLNCGLNSEKENGVSVVLLLLQVEKGVIFSFEEGD